ncbi:MAG: hypothetical protein LC797_23700, partial [Chloroflexi bacterium]|nr:hypothetical protein [Chloroflexota bacterium]
VLLYRDGTHEEARVEYARVVLDAEDGRELADALAAVGRTSVHLSDSAVATATLVAAERLYRAIGDSLLAERIVAEKMSLVTSVKQLAGRRISTEQADV